MDSTTEVATLFRPKAGGRTPSAAITTIKLALPKADRRHATRWSDSAEEQFHSNRSLPIIEQVSRLPARILKYTEQRPASEKRLMERRWCVNVGAHLRGLATGTGTASGAGAPIAVILS